MEYNFAKIKSAVSLSKEFILKNLDDSTILFYYAGHFKLNKAICSIFDKGDKKPSTMFYLAPNGRITYIDFRTNQKWDCFAFIQELFGCTFREALERVAQDFALIEGYTSKVSRKVLEEASKLDKEQKGQSLIQFEPDIWNHTNLSYWRKYEITQKELEENKVYPVKRLFLNHSEIYVNSQLRFAYPQEFGEKQIGVKIYSPYSTEMKWLSSIPLDIPFGLDSLPYTDNKVIICKSQKDRILMLKFFTDVIATQNEGTGSLSEEVQSLLKRRYSHRIINWDADNVGIENCKKFNHLGFSYWNTPKEEYIKYGFKDPSDIVAAYGLESLEILLRAKNLIN